MNYATHQELAQIVGEKAASRGINLDVESFVGGATIPDYVDDLLVLPPGQPYWKSRILGYPISPFQHFAKPSISGRYSGYCMARDPSWPKEIKPPLGTLKCHPSQWCKRLDMTSLDPEPHPMKSILDVTSSKAPNRITYCTAPVYAAWIAKQITRASIKKDPEPFWTGAGAIAHLAMDMCVWHHVFLCLLNGHQAYEGGIQEWAIANRPKIEKWELPAVVGPYEIRNRLEMMAQMTGARKSKPPYEWAVRKGFEMTYMVVLWAQEQLK